MTKAAPDAEPTNYERAYVMQTYHDAISRLTESQKIQLLTDFYSTTASKPEKDGLPQVQIARWEDFTKDRYPSPYVLARSWDTELISHISAAVCRDMARAGVRLAILPGAKSGIGDPDTSLSEDPQLSAALCAAFAQGAARMGIRTCLDGYEAPPRVKSSFTEERVKYEHLSAPFATAVASGGCVGVIAAEGTVPESLLDADGTPLLTFRAKCSDKETVLAIGRGEICMEGSAIALRRAMLTHKRLQAAVDHDKASPAELEEAIREGEAISEDAVNAALEKLFYLTDLCNRQTVSGEPVDESNALSQKALAASSVLLKNRKSCLPLAGPSKVAVIGDITSLSATPEEIGQTLLAGNQLFVGYAPGYRLGEMRNDDLLEEALRLCDGADTVLLFAGNDRTACKNILPPNQLALCERLGECKKKTVLIVSSDHAADLTSTEQLQNPPEAMLLAPLNVAGGVMNALQLVLGAQLPGGRLTHTLTDSRTGLSSRKKTGPFVGYRYYDTMGAGALYPFGHGLSYEKLVKPEIAALSVGDGSVRFRMTNVGSHAGVAVAQVYVGIKDSAILRPEKELVAFAHAELSAGESREITLPLRALPVLDENGSLQTEAGKYTVYVGTSVESILAHKTFSPNGTALSPDGEELYEYLPSVTNIFKEHYTLEADELFMKPSLRNILFGIGALLLALAVKIFDIATYQSSLFLNTVSALLAVCAIVFFILESHDRKKLRAAAQAKADAANAELFAQADVISIPSADELFDSAALAVEEEAPAEGFTDTSVELDYFTDVDKSLSFPDAASELIRLAAEKGIVLDNRTALGIFASFASSRMMLIKGMSDKQFADLVSLLGAYFDCHAGIDTVSDQYRSEADVLFENADSAQGRVARYAMQTVQAAREKRRNIHILPFTNVTAQALSDCFGTLSQYARAPFGAHSVTVRDSDGRSIAYRLPENLWFLLRLAPGETLDAIPDYIAETSTLNTWQLANATPVANMEGEVRAFRYGQMLYLCDKLKSAFLIDESIWKRIDRLEAFAARYSQFHIGNKLWLGLEAYLAVLTDAKLDAATALDEALAVKLLPTLIQALSGKLSRDDTGLGETLDRIFGDDNTVLCRKAIKDSGAPIL